MKKMMNVALILSLAVCSFAQAETLTERINKLTKPSEVSAELKKKLDKVTEAAVAFSGILAAKLNSVPSDTRMQEIDKKLVSLETSTQEHADQIVSLTETSEQLKVDIDAAPAIIEGALRALLTP